MDDKNIQKSSDKINFLSELIKMDKEQISKMIKEKSKRPKPICPIITLRHENK